VATGQRDLKVPERNRTFRANSRPVFLSMGRVVTTFREAAGNLKFFSRTGENKESLTWKEPRICGDPFSGE